MAGEGGLRALVALSRVDDLQLKVLAVGALRHLSLDTRIKRPMVDEGILGPIFGCEQLVTKQLKCAFIRNPQSDESILRMSRHSSANCEALQLAANALQLYVVDSCSIPLGRFVA